MLSAEETAAWTDLAARMVSGRLRILATVDELATFKIWLAEIDETIAAQVNVRELERGGGPRTVVTIDHRLHCRVEIHSAGWRVSTKPTFLPAAHFSSHARHLLKTATAERGRTLYCHDLLSNEVIAALSYHIDQRSHFPVLITAIGLRIDCGSNAFLVYRSVAGALLLKQYVHAIAMKIGRGDFVDLDLAEGPSPALMSDFGFRAAPAVKGFRPGGKHLRQDAMASGVSA
jgi:hypothetical protein